MILLDDEAMASTLFARARQFTSDFVGLAARVTESGYSSLCDSVVRFVETIEGYDDNVTDHLVVWLRSISSDISEFYVKFKDANESDSVLCALKRHVVLSWLALSLYRNGFQSISKND